MKTTDEIMGLVAHYGNLLLLANPPKPDKSTAGFIAAMQEKFDEIRAAITASMDWRPMDSAPKDGEPVLVYKGNERRVGSYMTAAYWGEWPDCEDCWIAVGGKPLGYFSKLAGAPQGYPTHWKPLPPPPAEGTTP